MTYKKFKTYSRKVLPSIPESFLTSNFDLETLAASLNIKNFKVYVSPLIDEILQENQNVIVNISKFDGIGHWCSVAFLNKQRTYFDSFKCLPPVSIRNFISGRYYGSHANVQEVNSSECGMFALYISYLLDRGLSLNDALYHLDSV